MGDFALNRDDKGRLIAAFPFDLVAWTDTVSDSLTKLSAAAQAVGAPAMVFASTGPVSDEAAAELKKLGWTVVAL